MRHEFQAEQWVPFSRERVFAFFADPANLPPLMPPWQDARIEHLHLVPPSSQEADASTPVVAGRGSRIDISFRPVPYVPFRLAWEASIVEFRWNESFCDEQGKGPFRYFRHCHCIRDEERDAQMGTVVSDTVEYELPLGILGDLANQLLVKSQLRSLFAHRQRMLLRLLAKH